MRLLETTGGARKEGIGSTDRECGKEDVFAEEKGEHGFQKKGEANR